MPNRQCVRLKRLIMRQINCIIQFFLTFVKNELNSFAIFILFDIMLSPSLKKLGNNFFSFLFYLKYH